MKTPASRGAKTGAIEGSACGTRSEYSNSIRKFATGIRYTLDPNCMVVAFAIAERST